MAVICLSTYYVINPICYNLCNQFSLLFYVENCDAKNDVKIKVLKNKNKKITKNVSIIFIKKKYFV